MKKMHKAALLSTISLAIASTSFAWPNYNGPYNNGPVASPYCGGFYTGIGLGIVHTDADVNVDPTVTINNILDTPSTLSVEQNTNAAENSFLGNIYLGYGSLLYSSPWYLGAEVFANIAQHDMTTNAYASNTTTSQCCTIKNTLNSHTEAQLSPVEGGIDIRPGYLITATTLLFGRVGVAFNELKYDQDNTFVLNANSSSASPGAELDISQDKFVAGLRLGFGLEQYVGKGFALSANYVWTDYGKVSASGVANSASLGSSNTLCGFQSGGSADVTSNSFTLGMSYLFGQKDKYDASFNNTPRYYS